MSDIQTIAIDFLNFLKKPSLKKLPRNNTNLIITFILLFLLLILTVYTLSIGIKIVIYLIDYKEASKLYSFQESKLNKYSTLNNILYILIVGPLIEELLNRFYLNLKKQNIIITLICLIVFLIKIYWQNVNQVGLFILATVLCTIVAFCALSQKRIDLFGLKYFHYIFYCSCVIFACLHIQNFQSVLSKNYYWLLPFLIFPQFFMGVFFGYIRVRFGFISGLLFHSVMNIPAVIIYLVS